MTALAVVMLGAPIADAKNTPQESGGESPPRPVRTEAPAYPFQMRRAGIEGSVLVEYIVGADGTVIDVQVVRSNNPSFDRPALNAVKKWRFQPGRKNGRAVNARVQQVITFNLEGGRSAWEVRKGERHDELPEEFRWGQAPRLTFSAFPVYPFEALVAGEGAKVRTKFIVGHDGHVIASEIVDAPRPEFGHAIVAAMETWQFMPARGGDGKLRMAIIHQEHTFDPQGDSGAPISPGTREVLRLLKKYPASIAALNELDALPEPVAKHPPIFPTALRKAGRDGEAVIEFFIDHEGDVHLPRVVSATAPEFGYAAVQAVSAWRFTPPKRKGKTVVTRARLPLGFKLESAEEEKP